MAEDKSALPEFVHTETEHGRLTVVTDKAKVERLVDEAGGIKVFFPDPDDPKHPQEFRLHGFDTIRDPAGVDVLYIKIKPQEDLLVYCLTDHPDTEKALEFVKEGIAQSGLPPMNFLNMEVTMREMLAATKAIANGTMKSEPGAHPNMKQYMPEEFK